MDLVVPCALLAHELGEQLDGYTPTERDQAITAQDPTQRDLARDLEARDERIALTRSLGHRPDIVRSSAPLPADKTSSHDEKHGRRAV